MKVIKKGKEKAKATMRVECEKCGAELEIEAVDLKLHDGSLRSDPVYYYYECQCCNNTNILYPSELTKEIHSDLAFND